MLLIIYELVCCFESKHTVILLLFIGFWNLENNSIIYIIQSIITKYNNKTLTAKQNKQAENQCKTWSTGNFDKCSRVVQTSLTKKKGLQVYQTSLKHLCNQFSE